MAKEIKILRALRDDVLLTNSVGTSLVEFYYKFSPPVANFIAKHDSLRVMVRWSLLPLVGVSWLAFKIGFVPALTLAFLMILLMLSTAVAVYKRYRAGQTQDLK